MMRLAEILSEYRPDGCRVLDCVSLADAECKQERHAQPVAYHAFVGARKGKAAFGLKALRVALRRRSQLAVVGHIGLVPVAWCLQGVGLIRSYILVLHGTEAWQRVGRLDRLASEHAKWIVSTTRYTGQEFCRYNDIPLDRVRVIPLAIADTSVDLVSRNSVSARGDLKVLTVSRLHRSARYKGIHTLIDAVARARMANAPISLTIAGGGDDVPLLREQVVALGLSAYVSFQGTVTDDALANLYQTCDVFAMPSKGEGFGIVFLEAMRYGKPCIGGRHGGTPEVIDDGLDGFLVEHGDVDQLTRCLLELSGNPALRNEMGERARRKVQNRFLIAHMRDNWFSLLEEALSAPRDPRQAVNESDAMRTAQ
jgi:glycosyltransferase involved in cell wall biosynthesis